MRPRIPFNIVGFEEHDIRELRFVLETTLPVIWNPDDAEIVVFPANVAYPGPNSRAGKVGIMVEQYMERRKKSRNRTKEGPPEIRFTAYVTPQPQGSMKAFVRNGRAILTSDNAKLKPCRSEIASCAIEAARAHSLPVPMAGRHVAVAIEARFYFRRPASVKREHHVVKPDEDKLSRMLKDALTGILYVDDAQVCRSTIAKLYGEPERIEVFAQVIAPREDGQ